MNKTISAFMAPPTILNNPKQFVKLIWHSSNVFNIWLLVRSSLDFAKVALVGQLHNAHSLYPNLTILLYELLCLMVIIMFYHRFNNKKVGCKKSHCWMFFVQAHLLPQANAVAPKNVLMSSSVTNVFFLIKL